MKRFLSILMCVVLVVTLLPAVAAATETTATTMRLVEHEGTVTVKNASGRTLKISEDMRLYNNYQITTDRKSYAYISLDDSKAIKLDASSKVTISRQGRKLEILVEKGKLLFNVTQPLKKDETLNIRTSTMITGVRGTIGWVEIITSQSSQLHLLEGSTLVTTIDPHNGSTSTTQVDSGQVLSTTLMQEDGQEMLDIELTDLNEEDTPGFVRTAISEDPEMQQRIDENTDLDIDAITENAEETLQQEEQTAEDAAREIQQELDQQTTENVDPLFEETSEPPAPSVPFPVPDPKPEPDPTPEPDPEPDPVPATFTVTFDLNGHGDAIDPQTISEGGLVTEPTAPTADGFTFEGWFKEADCINEWDFAADAVTADTTLYAKWTANTYTVTFDMNGHGDAIDPQTITEGGLVTEPTAPTADGFTFEGWFKEADCINEWVFAADAVTADTTLYAKWTANTYTVTFDMSGHGDAIDPQTISEGGLVTEPTAPTADGFTFDGWFTDAAGTTEWDFAADTVTADITLYAKWTEIPSTTNLDNPTAEELTAALQEAAESVYITDVAVTNANVTLDTLTVAEGDVLTLSSGDLSVAGETNISGTVNIESSATLTSSGTLAILSSESLHITGTFVNNGDLLIGGLDESGTPVAGALVIESAGRLENSGTITIDADTASTLTNIGTLINSGDIIFTAEQFIHTGHYEDTRSDVYAMCIGGSTGSAVTYLDLLSKLEAWTGGDTLVLHGNNPEGTTVSLPEALLTIDAHVSLDLNGFTIVIPEAVTDGNACLTISENASLIVMDSSLDGTGTITSASSHCTIDCQGTFTLESGTIKNTNSSGYYSPAIYSSGYPCSIVIRGGTVSAALHAISNKDQSGVYGSITIEGGTITGGTCAIYNGANSYPLIISGGTISSEGTVIVSGGAYDADFDSGTLISGDATIRLSAAYSETTSAALISGDCTIESCYLMALDPSFFDALQMELPQETGPDSEGYYTVDLTDTSADPTAWTLTDPTEAALLRVLGKSYVTTLTISHTDGNATSLSQSAAIPDGMTVTLTSGEICVDENAALNIYGTLTIETGATITNNGTIEIGSDDFPSAIMDCRGGTLTNSGIYLDNTYLQNTRGSYITVSYESADDGNTVFVYCGAADGTSWFLSPGNTYTVTFYVEDSTQFLIPDSFGDYESTVEINLTTAMLTDTQYTAAVTTESGTLTLGKNVTLFIGYIEESGETVTMPESELFHFTGSISTSSTAVLTSLYSTFEANNSTAVISVTGNGSSSADMPNIQLMGCTVIQNGSGAAIELSGAYAYLSALDTESETVAMTVTGSGNGIVCDTTSGIAASGMVLNAADTGIIYSGTGGSLMNCTITSIDGTGIECTGADLLLNGCTVTSENGIGIENSGSLYLDVYENETGTVYCTVSGATYALYNTGSVSSTATPNTFILTSADGFYTVFSDTSEATDALVELYGTFKAKDSSRIFSEQVAQEDDKPYEEYDDTQTEILFYVIQR